MHHLCQVEQSPRVVALMWCVRCKEKRHHSETPRSAHLPRSDRSRHRSSSRVSPEGARTTTALRPRDITTFERCRYSYRAQVFRQGPDTGLFILQNQRDPRRYQSVSGGCVPSSDRESQPRQPASCRTPSQHPAHDSLVKRSKLAFAAACSKGPPLPLLRDRFLPTQV